MPGYNWDHTWTVSPLLQHTLHLFIRPSSFYISMCLFSFITVFNLSAILHSKAWCTNTPSTLLKVRFSVAEHSPLLTLPFPLANLARPCLYLPLVLISGLVLFHCPCKQKTTNCLLLSFTTILPASERCVALFIWGIIAIVSCAHTHTLSRKFSSNSLPLLPYSFSTDWIHTKHLSFSTEISHTQSSSLHLSQSHLSIYPNLSLSLPVSLDDRFSALSRYEFTWGRKMWCHYSVSILWVL